VNPSFAESKAMILDDAPPLSVVMEILTIFVDILFVITKAYCHQNWASCHLLFRSHVFGISLFYSEI
jgi:hypothetical protein